MSRAPHLHPRRRPQGPPRLARICTAVAVAVAVALTGSTAAFASGSAPESRGASAGAQPTLPAPQLRPTADDTPAEEGTADTATLLVAPADPVLRAEADTYRFTVLLRNEGDLPLPAGTLRLSLDQRRVESIQQLEAGEESTTVVQLAQQSVPQTKPGEEQSLTISVPRSALPLDPLTEQGVYSVRGELRLPVTEPLEAKADPLLVSEPAPFVWQGVAGSGTVPVTLVVPFVFPESVRTMPSETQLREAVTRFTQLLDVAEQTQATLAVDPRVVAAITVQGDNAPQAARELLARLGRTSRPVFMLQFADADPAAQAALGFEELLRPLGFGYLERGNTTTGGADTDTAETADSGDSSGANPAASDPAIVSELPQAYAGAWPAAGNVDSATLSLLGASDLTSLVLDSENVSGATGTRIRVGEFGALVADHSLSESTRYALGGATTAERNSGIAGLTARLAVAAGQGFGGLVLAVDRGAISEAEDPAELLSAIAALDWVTPVPDSMQPEGVGALRSGDTPEQRRELLRAATVRSAQIDSLAPLLSRPASLVEYQRFRLLESFATRYASSDVDFARIGTRIGTRDEELLRGVQIVPTENTQLVGTSSRVPVTLHNALPFEARVLLRATPTSAGVSVPTRTYDDARVPAGGNHVVLVRVESRISSGESGLHIEVAERSGEKVFSERTLRLTIRSSYETILLISLGAVAALLLGFGIWRSMRRREQAPREAELAAEPES